MAENVIRLGVAGLGEAATEFLPAYSRHPRAKLVACADLRANARRHFETTFGARSYASIEELCEQPDVDAIVVATNHEYHTEPVEMAATAGKHVIVEKPLALSLADCDRMIEACARGNVLLLGAHNHSYDPAIRKMREIIVSGEYGPLRMVNAWNYNDFMVRPYPAEHIEQSRGVVLNQGAHQVDMLRLLGGGKLRSVRAVAGRWDHERPGEGAYVAFFEFEDGTPATLVYNGYGFFDTAEFMGWLGEGGGPRMEGVNAKARRRFYSYSGADREAFIERYKEGRRFGATGDETQMPDGWQKGGRPSAGVADVHQPRFGVFVVTCNEADIRQTADGLRIYGNEIREVPLAGISRGRTAELDELCEALFEGKPLVHSGAWCKASIEACLAILRSSEERREIFLEHQVAVGDVTAPSK